MLVGTSVAVAAILGSPIAGANLDSLAVALAFGLVLVALVNSLGHISGCPPQPSRDARARRDEPLPLEVRPGLHRRPSSWGPQPPRWVVWASFGDRARDMAKLAAPSSDASFASAFLVEAVITFLLVLVVISVATDGRVEAAGAGVAVGFALAAAVLVGGPITGGSVNPARALGPMIVSGSFTDVAVYLLRPSGGWRGGGGAVRRLPDQGRGAEQAVGPRHAGVLSAAATPADSSRPNGSRTNSSPSPLATST